MLENYTPNKADIPQLVKTFGIGEGETGGFVHLKAKDIENIYKIAAKASL